MARVLTLSDGTDAINLVDGVNYDVLQGGVETPPPERRSLYARGNPFKDGDDLVTARYANRTVTVHLRLKGASHDSLIAAIRGIEKLLVKAQDAQVRGWGSAVYLQYQWQDATNAVYFDVLEGDLRYPPNYMSILLDQHKTILDAELVLTCKPFARGVASASHENYVDNPSFEEGATAPGDSWTVEGGGSVTATFNTTNKKYGARSLNLVIT